ncbi:MAG: hypothetical protein ACW98K_06470 [Candidatus Kariarchaeaceae archaeon]|jgi:hypothetical protein
MNNFKKVYFLELRDIRAWNLWWVFGMTLYNILILLVYPGESGVEQFMDLLQEEAFQAFLGDIGGEDPGFTLWVAMMSPMLAMLYMIFVVLSGVRVAIKGVEDNTGELIHTLPISRTNLLLYRTAAATTYILLLLLLWLGPLLFYLDTIPLIRIINTSWWGLLYTFAGLCLGILIGLVVGGMERGQQTGLLAVLIFYAVQILGRFSDTFLTINEFNILEWYLPFEVLLRNNVDGWLVLRLLLFATGTLYLSVYIFERRDLNKDTSISLLSPIRKRVFKSQTSNKKKVKSTKNSFFTFWVKPFRSKFPYTADFVYSERTLLLTVFYMLVIIWPMQLLTYPGEESLRSVVEGFADNPMMKLFTYNHDVYDVVFVYNHHPINSGWLWYIITQAIGGHYIILLPLVFYWINKVVKHDGQSLTGEIMGSIPVTPRRVVLERIFAISLEMIWMIAWMIFWLVLSERTVDETVNLKWEIIAIISVFPLYYFILCLTLTLGFVFERNGVKIARGFAIAVLLLFVVGMLNESLHKWYILGIFGLYDPLLIIADKTLAVQNSGVILLWIMSILSTILLYRVSKNFSWLDINDKKAELSELHPPLQNTDFQDQ